MDWNTVNKWKLKVQHEEVLVSMEGISESELLQAKLEELNKWKQNNVYAQVPYTDQTCISVRWVSTEKFVNGNRVVKSHLVGFEENQENVSTDSPTCSKESFRAVLTVLASKKWLGTDHKL